MLQLLLGLWLLSPSEDPRCTVATRKGDIVEGALRAATATEIVVVVAGQELRFPLGDIKYVSFVGRLDAASDAGKDSATKLARGTMQDAFAALDDLEGVLRVGVLREQYSAKLIETLPRVNAFIDAGKDWADARLALVAAIAEFKGPLGEISRYSNPWADASEYFSRAGQFVAFAKHLASMPAEQNHTEDPKEKPLAIGQLTEGRLGYGDQQVSEMLAKGEFTNCLADLYVFRADRPGKLIVQAAGVQPRLHLALTGPNGVAMGQTRWGDKEWKRDLKMSGEYRLWVIARYGQIGIYAVKGQPPVRMQLQGHDDARRPPKPEPLGEAWRKEENERPPTPAPDDERPPTPSQPPPESDRDRGSEDGAG